MLEQFNGVEAIGAAAGYLVGQGLDKLSTDKTKQVIGAISSSHEAAAKAIEQDQRLYSVAIKIGRRLLTPLALSGALTGALFASAYGPEQAKATIPANIEIVVDHSGGTPIDGTINEINQITESFNGNKDFRSQAIVSGSGINIPMNTADVPSNNPFGIATLDQALSQAVGQITSIDSSKTSSSHEGAVLIISDNNSIGSLNQDEALAGSSHIPVFTVDVSSSHDQVSEDLGALSKDSKGKSWQNPDSKQQSEIPDQVYASLNASSSHENIIVNSNRDSLRMLSFMALAATGVLAWKRRYVLFDRDSSGN